MIGVALFLENAEKNSPMKTLFILFLLSCSTFLFSQTDSIEKNIMFKKFLDGKIDQPALKQSLDNWRKTVSKFKVYPEMPVLYDSTYGVSFLVKFDNQSVSNLYNRTLEWFAMYAKPGDAIKYSNVECGKIVFVYSMILQGNKLWTIDKLCHFIVNMSMKQNKIYFEVSKFEYEYTVNGSSSYDSYSPDRTYYVPFQNIYPLILKPESSWKDYFDLINDTKEQSENVLKDIVDYIETYDERYKF